MKRSKMLASQKNVYRWSDVYCKRNDYSNLFKLLYQLIEFIVLKKFYKLLKF